MGKSLQFDLESLNASLAGRARELADSGNYIWAVAVLEPLARALEDGPDPVTASGLGTLDVLAEVLRGLGLPRQELDMRARAYAASVRASGPGDLETVRRKHDLASAALRAGEPERAMMLYGESLADGSGEARGHSRLAAVRSLQGLAEAAEAEGDWGSARLLRARTLSEVERELGPRHPDALDALDALAGTLEASESRHAAWAARVRSIAETGMATGPGWLGALASAGPLALAETARGDMRAASRLRLEALTARLLDMGPGHPISLASSERLETALQGLAAADRERELCLRELGARSAALGTEHPLAALKRLGLSGALDGLGGLGQPEAFWLD
ncbi:MAG: hypothetical protein LBT40_16825 [Deltaproteobacteria bacterium]|nr:hypothetical protein [Deltaproteobacteria bacterium]